MLNLRTYFLGIFALSSSLFANEGEGIHSGDLVSWRHPMSLTTSTSKPTVPEEPPPQECTYSYVTWEGWADFLYWQAIQENMEPAGLITDIQLIGFVGTDSGLIVNMDFNYKPAFAVGVGSVFDQTFDVNAEYTRFYSTETTSASGNQYYPMQLDPSILISYLNGISDISGIGGAAPYSFHQKWQLEMNLVNLDFGRFKYEQNIIKLHPFIGMRGAWISQDLKTHYTANLVNGGAEVGTAELHVKTGSWGVGLRGGMDTSCTLGAGFKFYGNGAGDLLYTQYNWHGIENATVVLADVNRNANVTQKEIQTVRLHLEAELGFSWGCEYKISKCRKGHVDIGAGYGFQIFFDQNMFRHFTTMFEEISDVATLIGTIGTPISNSPNGNLYIQGLRLNATFNY